MNKEMGTIVSNPLYFLTGHHHARRRVYGAVNEILGLTSELPLESDEAFIFPTAPLVNALFHYGREGDPVLLWRLFGSAVAGIDRYPPQISNRAYKLRAAASRS